MPAKLFCGWFLLLTMDCFAIEAQTLASNLMQEPPQANQAMRPKVKRTQELLMFGNQQNRQTENNAASGFSSPAEKRMFTSSGLEDSKDSVEDETFSHVKSPSNYLIDHEMFPQNEQKYDYGKVLVNELGDVLNVPPYPYYNSEDRRKRSDEIAKHSSTSTAAPSPSSLPATYSTHPPVAQTNNKKGLPFYQEPRYKRESEIDPEAMLELLQAWENEHRSRNWRNLANDEYDNVEADSNLIGVEEEDPRTGLTWSEGPMYPPAPHHYSIGVDSLVPSDIGIPRTHPANYYDQYGSQFGQQYDVGRPQYGSAQYGAIYPQHSYYPQEKRLMAFRKRSAQGYDSYGGRNGLMNMAQLLAASRGYPNYQHRFMY